MQPTVSESRKPSGYVMLLLTIVVLIAGVVAYDRFFGSDEIIEIRAAVTIINPERIGMSSETCSANSFKVEITSFNKHVEERTLGVGDGAKAGDDSFCRFTFTTSVPKSESFELSAPGENLPTKRLNRISDRSFTDGDDEYVFWEVVWEP